MARASAGIQQRRGARTVIMDGPSHSRAALQHTSNHHRGGEKRKSDRMTPAEIHQMLNSGLSVGRDGKRVSSHSDNSVKSGALSSSGNSDGLFAISETVKEVSTETNEPPSKNPRFREVNEDAAEEVDEE